MSNKKYTEMTDMEIKQHLDDTAKWLSKMGYDGDAIMRPEHQHINEQNAEIERLETTIADLKADLRQAEHERNVLRNARLCKATCRDQKERLKRETADLRARLEEAVNGRIKTDSSARLRNRGVTAGYGRRSRNGGGEMKDRKAYTAKFKQAPKEYGDYWQGIEGCTFRIMDSFAGGYIILGCDDLYTTWAWLEGVGNSIVGDPIWGYSDKAKAIKDYTEGNFEMTLMFPKESFEIIEGR